jgi:hypothetical protein
VTVADQQSTPLPGAVATLVTGEAPRVQITDAAGEGRFLDLPPATYNLVVGLEGFSTLEYPNSVIVAGRNTNLSFTMSPALQEVALTTGLATTALIHSLALNQEESHGGEREPMGGWHY